MYKDVKPRSFKIAVIKKGKCAKKSISISCLIASNVQSIKKSQQKTKLLLLKKQTNSKKKKYDKKIYNQTNVILNSLSYLV